MKKPAKRRQPRSPAKNETEVRRFDRAHVGNYLRILFELDFIARQMGTAGLTVKAGWLPDGFVYDIICDQVFGPGKMPADADVVFYDAWNAYREYFGTREEFDPERFLAWLEAGDFSRNPFPEKPQGLWTLPFERPVC